MRSLRQAEEDTKGWKSGAAAGFHQSPRKRHGRGNIPPPPRQESPAASQELPHPSPWDNSGGRDLWFIPEASSSWCCWARERRPACVAVRGGSASTSEQLVVCKSL